ncbi:MAG: GlsB/YeaQ/YmgE family stress response rane protein [Actinomycetia bacterium]|nr:GlsB/YeaQ/YmgE family stress response rane protein [Actinomycetes bacterium]
MILLFILVWGMFAGWIAHLLLARNEPVNWAELLVVGLAGSFVGGLLISLLSGDGLALRPSGIIGSIIGAVLLLLAWRTFRSTPRRRAR